MGCEVCPFCAGENRCKKHGKNEKNLQNTSKHCRNNVPYWSGCMLAAVPSFSLPSVHPRRTPRCDWLKWDHFLPMARATGADGGASPAAKSRDTPQRTPLMNLTSASNSPNMSKSWNSENGPMFLKSLKSDKNDIPYSAPFKLLLHLISLLYSGTATFLSSTHHPSSPAVLPEGPPKISTTRQLAGDIHTSFLGTAGYSGHRNPEDVGVMMRLGSCKGLFEENTWEYPPCSESWLYRVATARLGCRSKLFGW